MFDSKEDLVSTQEMMVRCEGGNPVDEHGFCDVSSCQHCCSHDERDHGVCLGCGQEEDFWAAVDAAQAAQEDR